MTPEEAFGALEKAIREHKGEIFDAQPPRGGLVRIESAPWTGPPLVGQMRVEPTATGQASIGLDLSSDWAGGGKFIALALALLLTGPIISTMNSSQLATIPIFLSLICAGGLFVLSLFHPQMTADKILDRTISRSGSTDMTVTESALSASTLRTAASPSRTAVTSQTKPVPVSSAHHQQPQPQGASEGSAVIQQIRALSELRSAGVISDDEFNAKKTALLAKL